MGLIQEAKQNYEFYQEHGQQANLMLAKVEALISIAESLAAIVSIMDKRFSASTSKEEK